MFLRVLEIREKALIKEHSNTVICRKLRMLCWKRKSHELVDVRESDEVVAIR